MDTLLRATADQAMDVVNIKISKFGGLTAARQARDLCASLGVAMTIEDSWGGEIATAAIAHATQATHDQWIVGQCLIGVDQRVEHLVVLGRRQRELVGDRAALAHYRPGGRGVEESNLLLIDWGAGREKEGIKSLRRAGCRSTCARHPGDREAPRSR